MRTHNTTIQGAALTLMILLGGLSAWTVVFAQPNLSAPTSPDTTQADQDGVSEPIQLHHERVRVNLVKRAPQKRTSRRRATRRKRPRATKTPRAQASKRTQRPQARPEPPMARRGRCPHDMVQIKDTRAEINVCMDRFEAPNRPGSLPLVMYTWYQAEAWCEARGKRLCYDDEWIRACRGPRGWNYPYGPTHREGACNDGKVWLQYDRILQRRWPTSVGKAWVEDLDELLTAAAASSPTGAESAEHIQWLYQAAPSGSHVECGSHEGVFDLIGNVEEWVRRREESGRPEFTNRLMGRFWAEKFSCGMTVSSHGNGFRFYEIGFRCCKDL